jgi:TRAP-type uncharacterized transport system fused permease subunit
VAAYVIAISVIGPMLGKLGLPLLSAHLFVFYYAIVSCITPPVAPVTYPASALSGAPWMSIAWIAMRLAVVGYIVPYFFVYNQPLLMMGSPLQIVGTTFFSILGVICLSAGLMGYLFKLVTIPERCMFIAAGIFFLIPNNVYHLAAVVLVLVGLASQKFMPPIPFFGRRDEAGV